MFVIINARIIIKIIKLLIMVIMIIIVIIDINSNLEDTINMMKNLKWINAIWHV